MNYAEELHQAYESAAFAVRHLERVAGDENVSPLLKLAARYHLKTARQLSSGLGELFVAVEGEPCN